MPLVGIVSLGLGGVRGRGKGEVEGVPVVRNWAFQEFDS